MANSRVAQRGFVQVGLAFVLAAFTLLLAATGCSAGGDAEPMGEASQSIAICACKNTACATYSVCNPAAGMTCADYETKAKDLTDCTDASGGGSCVSGVCCRTCWRPGFIGYICAKQLDGDNCAAAGGACKICSGAVGVCEANTCDANGVCGVAKVQDGQSCTDNSGKCYKGACCSGCMDAGGTCQTGTDTKLCGAAGSMCANCVDADPCTTDSCQGGMCAHGAQPDNTPCPDNTKCNGDEVCVGGKCQGPANFMCPTDMNPCHAPSCDPITGCAQQPLSNVSCSDGNKCNGDEMCSAGTCKAGTAPSCDDNNPCTVDSCDPTQGCVNTPVEAGTNCDADANVCNGSAACNALGKCVAIAAPKCDDGNPCTDDKCDPVKGCFTTNNTAPCSDNNLCTTNDKCSGGNCVGGPAPNCADKETCTDDSCDPLKGCVNAPVMDGTGCDDSNKCTTTDKCVGGVCKGSGGPSCEDNNPCTQNFCDVNNMQACTNPPEMNGTPCTLDRCHQNATCTGGVCGGGIAISCDDSNPCTVDSCDPMLGCKHDPDPKATCSDGDICTTGDACVNGTCVGTAKVCKPIDECHVAGKCGEQTGQCDDPRADDNTPCKGGKGTCQSGLCQLNSGAGGAGGDGAGGDATTQGGDSTVGSGGEGNLPGAGGDGSTTGGTGGMASTGGKTGSSSGGEGGEPERPEHPFVREPGGCACRAVGQSPSGNAGLLGSLLGLVAVGAAISRRRRSGRDRKAA